ncbi:hypothetical protein HPB47_024181 [Ixodes persulcatus]|uniref:Uncharacterized protein n=1 Tax=Ixodes persulcatus TaxID=34615 RepID=A0AC60Q5J1_IXOPE|nr:hypothetical protein HPB47_024181 [Ixodes persulcatus]
MSFAHLRRMFLVQTVALACLCSPFYGSPYATDGSVISLARHHLDARVLMSNLLSTTEGSSTYHPSTMPLNKLAPRLSSPVSLPPSQEATASTPSSLERRLRDKRLREICICFTGLGGTPAMGFARQCRMFFVQAPLLTRTFLKAVVAAFEIDYARENRLAIRRQQYADRMRRSKEGVVAAPQSADAR